MDVPVISMLPTGKVSGPPSYPPFKLVLGPTAPLVQVHGWWQQSLQQQFVRRNVTIRLQALDGGVWRDATRIVVHDTFLSSFTLDIASGSSITLIPDYITVAAAEPPLDASLYGIVDLPVLASPTIEFSGEPDLAGVSRASGAEITMIPVQNPIGETRDPTTSIQQSISDLRFTAVARAATTMGGAVDLDAFTKYYDWAQAALFGVDTARTLSVVRRSLVDGTVLTSTAFACLPTRFNFINPVLIQNGIAPWVFDVVARPLSTP
jgi:hypothetical protein